MTAPYRDTIEACRDGEVAREADAFARALRAARRRDLVEGLAERVALGVATLALLVGGMAFRVFVHSHTARLGSGLGDVVQGQLLGLWDAGLVLAMWRIARARRAGWRLFRRRR